MSAVTPTAGYPVHRVETFRRWTNVNRVNFTDWTAPCGARGTDPGHHPFGLAGRARRAELCRECFTGEGCAGYFPDPREITDTETCRHAATYRAATHCPECRARREAREITDKGDA